MADDRDPDFSADPRGNQDVGQGYPETQEGTGDDSSIDDGEYPDKSERGGTPSTGDAPSSDSEDDHGPSRSTGNPNAAG